MSRKHAILTANFGAGYKPGVVPCGDCRGKGFDPNARARTQRRCFRCRGSGLVRVGTIKR